MPIVTGAMMRTTLLYIHDMYKLMKTLPLFLYLCVSTIYSLL